MREASEYWQDRVKIPYYQVKEAARYANIDAGSIARWNKRQLISKRPDKNLNYFELIEIAVVAAFRKAGVSLTTIEKSKKYLKTKFNFEYPFAHYNFKKFGKGLIASLVELDPTASDQILIRPDRYGQLAWQEILGEALQEFDYDKNVVLRWRVFKHNPEIIIDPRICFGAPSLKGVSTWIIAEQFKGGATTGEIASDYNLSEELVGAALTFEKLSLGPTSWEN